MHDVSKGEPPRHAFVMVSYATLAFLAVVWHWFFMFDGYSYFFLLCLGLLDQKSSAQPVTRPYTFSYGNNYSHFSTDVHTDTSHSWDQIWSFPLQ